MDNKYIKNWYIAAMEDKKYDALVDQMANLAKLFQEFADESKGYANGKKGSYYYGMHRAYNLAVSAINDRLEIVSEFYDSDNKTPSN